MGSLKKRGEVWRAQVFKRGIRDSGTFPNRQQAIDWIVQREAMINAMTDLSGNTFGDAVNKRLAMAGTSKYDRLRLLRFPREWETMPLTAITPEVISAWRDVRLSKVKAGTVLRERTVLRSLFEIARKEWKWVTTNPVADSRPPKAPQR